MVPLDTVTFGTALFDAVRAGDFFVSYGDYAATDNHMFSLFDTLGQAVGRFGKFPDDGMSDGNGGSRPPGPGDPVDPGL